MRLLLIAFVLLLATSTSRAQQTVKAAASGKPLMLYRAYNVNPNCSAEGAVTIKVLVPPQHGRVTVGTARIFPAYPPAHPRNHCNQRRVLGTQAFYTSQRGYAGRDHAVIEVIFPAGRYQRRSFGIVVR